MISYNDHLKVFSIVIFLNQMEIEPESCLPLQVAVKYYSKWDCDVENGQQNSIYYKYLSGIGRVTFLNGNTYQGHFCKGLMHGQGTYSWQNGLVYEGQFTNNSPSGQGKLTWPDGSRYHGDVINGKRQGNGEYYCAKDGSIYKGEWVGGFKQGKGTLTFSNSSVYQGQFKKGVREGWGRMRYPSGNEYDGEWKKDKKEGKGIMSWYSSFEKYEGEWQNDLPQGTGTYYWFENKVETKAIKTMYKGEWKQGKREGIGAFFYNNGCRMEGTFKGNLKEGICAITDQFGETHLELFKHDKSCLKQSHKENSLKLPDLKATIHNNEPTQNTYIKMIDINSPLIDESIFNLLLRANSQLRNDYKTLINSANKEIFNGLNIEAIWKLVKDMNVSNSSITLAKLNRKFYEGSKSKFEITIPNKIKMDLLKNNSNILDSHSYQDLEWELAFEEFANLELNWQQWPQKVDEIDLNKISLRNPVDIHNQDHVILYRHFIVYLLHLALLQYQQYILTGEPQPFRKCLEDIISTAKSASLHGPVCAPSNNMISMKTVKNCSQVHTNISHNAHKLAIPLEYSQINKELFVSLNEARSQLINTIDQTLSVKQLYTLLCQCGVLKQATEKMLFLEKIQRSMDFKGSILKKENKQYFAAFQKVVLNSPHFSHIMNYEMIRSQFDDILFKLLNRKIGNTHSKEDFLKKYKETIQQMTQQIKLRKKEVTKDKKKVEFKWKRVSNKDKQRQQLLKKLEEERLKRLEEEMKQKELTREARQRKMMAKEDHNINQIEESQESEQYYD